MLNKIRRRSTFKRLIFYYFFNFDKQIIVFSKNLSIFAAKSTAILGFTSTAM